MTTEMYFGLTLALPLAIIMGIALSNARHLLTYAFRSIWTRKLTTALTIGGIALVAFVFAAILMLASGLEKALVTTGYAGNAIVLRKAAQAELQSQIDRETASIILTLPEVMLTSSGKPFGATELFVLINIHKITGEMANVTVRGVSEESMDLRPQVKLKDGRMFTRGTEEIVVGSNLAERFQDCQIGKQLRFGNATWTVVGIIDAHGSAFDSEIWGDVEQLLPAFGRPVFSSLTMRVKSDGDFQDLKTKVESDRRTNFLEVKRERDYYLEQSQFMAMFIRIMGLTVTLIFSLGAIIGAMITMFAAVANRTVEIGTLRALGFRRRSILASFLVEAMVISVAGSLIGLAAASFLQFFVISTLNFGTFSELSFSFDLTTPVVVFTILFAVIMGIAGGVLPAARAARMQIVNALRAA